MAVRKEVSHLCKFLGFILVISILHMEMGGKMVQTKDRQAKIQYSDSVTKKKKKTTLCGPIRTHSSKDRLRSRLG